MRQKTINLYQFDELPTEQAKETAREWLRQLEAQDFDPEYEQYETAAKLLGITFDSRAFVTVGGHTRHESDIRYDLSYCQGAGASFVGTYEFIPDCATAIRAEFGTNANLHQIADGLTVFYAARRLLGKPKIHVKIKQDNNHYCHKRTMSLSVDVDDPELDDERAFTEKDEETLLELMRDFAQWIYDGLLEEYEYRQSDEALDATMQANEYEFDEDGERV